jgi:hypothetical protein
MNEGEPREGMKASVVSKRCSEGTAAFPEGTQKEKGRKWEGEGVVVLLMLPAALILARHLDICINEYRIHVKRERLGLGVGTGVKGVAEGKPSMVDLIESGRLDIHTSKLSFHLTLHRTPAGWAQKNSHGVSPNHLLQDGDEELDPSLSRMKSGCVLSGKQPSEIISIRIGGKGIKLLTLRWN